MKHLFALLFLILFTSTGFAQKQMTRYYDKDWGNITANEPSVHYYAVYTLDEINQINGDYKIYYSASKKRYAEGQYKNNKRVGIWKYWHENGQKSEEKIYRKTEDGTVNKLINYWTKDGTQLIKDGEGHFTDKHDNGLVAWEGDYKDSVKVGKWTYHTKEGTLRYEEEYTDEGVTGINYLNEEEQKQLNKKTVTYDAVDVHPEPVEGYEAFYKYIVNTLRYPRQAKRRGDEGQVLVAFKVNKDGAVSDINVLHSVCEELDNAAMDVIKESPKWKAGMHRGLKIVESMAFPLNFKLK